MTCIQYGWQDDLNIDLLLEQLFNEEKNKCVRCDGVGKVKYLVLEDIPEKNYEKDNIVFIDCPNCLGHGLITNEQHAHSISIWEKFIHAKRRIAIKEKLLQL